MDEEETLSLNENAAQLRMAKPVIRSLNRPVAGHTSKSRLSKAFHRHLHIINWIRTYDRNTAMADLIAGFTLGLTMIPQSIAYASLANLPSQYGLYAAFMGSLIYVFVGTVKEVSIGPTSLMALLTVQYTFGKPVEFVIVLGFLAGCVELLMGIFKLGFIVDFISVPVTSAFTSATSLIIIGSQLKSLLGISYTAKDFFQTIVKLVTRITELRAGDSVLGVICIVFLLSLRVSWSWIQIGNPTGLGGIQLCGFRLEFK
jgi:solute carrier family 26 (sodium-independent sulfate anion transporter), member 11